MSKYEVVLFDLDGTITESAPGIRKCIECTLDEMGYSHPDLSDYSNYVGPPLVNTFNGLCGLPIDKAYEAIVIYRKYYNIHGIENNFLFDGIKEVLDTLKENNIKIAICSSKTEHLAKAVLDFLGITEYFSAVCGSLPDGTRKEKEELIPYALDTLGINDNSKAVLVGDTKFDAKGARLTGTDFIGVSYGYGTIEQMKSEGAINIASNAKEILKYIL